jgi:phosphoribosylglycinamide formyltransferase-1
MMYERAARSPPRCACAIDEKRRHPDLSAAEHAAPAEPGGPDYPAEVARRPNQPRRLPGPARRFTCPRRRPRRVCEREEFEAHLDEALTAAHVDLVCLAGFLRLLTPGMADKWRDRMLNIHPSLLPSFRGLNTHERALAAWVKIAGCTVHLVRPEVDTGPILAQAAVPVLETDTPETLAARVLAAEHVIYPQALAAFAAGLATLDGDRVRLAVAVNQSASLFSPVL